MFGVQTTVSTSDVRLSTQDTLVAHLEAILAGLQTEGAYHVVALNEDNKTLTVYSLEGDIWCVATQRELQEEDWYLFQEEQTPECPEGYFWNGRQCLKQDNLLRPSLYEREGF